MIYLEEQLRSVKIQANQSMRAAQAFALTHRLGIQDGMPASIKAGSNAGSVETNREASKIQLMLFSSN